MFGQKTTFGTSSAFGTTPTFGSTFGQTTQAGTTSLFGAKPTVSFGTTGTTGGLFGTPSSSFGQPGATQGAAGGLFGGTSTFSTPAAGTLFGGSATQAKPLFGATTSTPFGVTTSQPNTGFTFGSTTGGGSLFGTQPQQTSAAPTLFGTTGQPTMAGSSLFGASTMTAPTGTTVKFNPKIDTDTMLKNNIQQNIQTKHQCITAMKEYESKSLEELRVEDYLAGRKGPAAGTQSGFTFGSTMAQPQQQTGGLFGATTTTAPATGSIFGQNKPLFGGTTFGTTTSSAAGTSLFGQPLQQQAGGLFGATATSKPLFGAATTAGSTFTFSTPSSTGGLFGQQQPQQSLFGTNAAAQPSLFGAATQQQQQPGQLFGTQNTGLAFGQQQPQQQGQGLFGTTNAFGTPASSAFSGFGQQTAAPFGAGTNLFGAKPATTTAPGFGGFGATNTFGTSGFGGFGTTTTQPSIFGAAQPQQQKPMFGGAFGTQQPAFGAQPGTTGTGLFGTTGTFGATGGQSLFGGQQQAKPGLNFGATGFGNTNLGFGNPGMMGATDQSQMMSLGTSDQAAYIQQEILKSQLLGLSTSPYGDRKMILGNKVSETSMLPVPTDPIAQKRIMDSTKSVSFGGALQQTKPLPPFKPASRLIIGSPSFGRQADMPTALPGIDSDTISFTEGFIPKKNIKKLILKPKGTDGGLSQSTRLTATGQRDISLPEHRALTTAIRSNNASNAERSAVQALNFDNTVYTVDSEDRTHSESSLLVENERSPTGQAAQRGGPPSVMITSATPRHQPAAPTTPEHASPSTVSSGSQTASPDENSPRSKHPAGIVLTRPEYYTVPSMKELEKMVDRQTGACVVDGFTVGRTGFGSVYWSGVTDVAGLDLDELVHFRHKEVTVYPDDEKKPSEGLELNKKAEITLERVWPVDKTTKMPIKDPKRLELLKYREKLEKATGQMLAEFIDYRPETGSWVFKVPHFSKYGLAEEADEEQPSMMELETTQQQLPVQEKVQRLKTKVVPQKEAYSAQRAVVDIGFSLDTGAKGLGGMDMELQSMEGDELLEDVEFDGDLGRTDLSMSRILGETTLYKTAPMSSGIFSEFFREIRHQDKYSPSDRELGGIMDELNESAMDKGRRAKRKPTMFTDLHEKSLSLLRKPDDDGAVIDLSQQQQPEVVPSPAPSLIGLRSEAVFLSRPKREIRLAPYERSVAVNRSRCWLDAGLYHGRRFRVGWAPMGILTSKGRMDGDEITQSGSIFGTGRAIGGPKEFSVTLANAVPETYLTGKADLDSLLRCQSELSEFDLTNEQRCSQLITTEDTVKVLASYKEAATELKEPQLASAVFGLCDALWGTLEKDLTREDLVSEWIMAQSKVIVDEAVDEHKRKGKEFYIDAVFALLTSRRIEEAAQLAQEAGDWRLSLIISQMVESGADVKALWLKQLTLWTEVEADKFIDTTRLKIFMLAAGMLKWKTSDGRMIDAYEGLDWKRTFGLYLWYACTPFTTLSRALDQYDAAWRNPNPNDGHELAAQPLVSYMELNEELGQRHRYWTPDATAKLDVCYHLMRLYTDRSYSIYMVLEPSTWTSDPFDFHLSWHLWSILRSLGLILVERTRLDTLHAQFAFQLERKGMWQRGIFVGLHIDDPCRREALVKQLLSQHARQCTQEDAVILVKEFGIPAEWVCNGI